MAKILIFTWSCVLIYLNVFGFSTAENCPQFYAKSDFDMKKLNGDWYELVEKRIDKIPTFSCTKYTFNVYDNGTITIDESETRLTDPDFRTQYRFETDEKEPGNLIIEMPIIDQTQSGPKTRDVTSKLGVIYADDDLVVLYSCAESQSLDSTTKNEGFNILARSRQFDSLSKFYAAATTLLDLDVDWNDMLIVYNGPNCKN